MFYLNENNEIETYHISLNINELKRIKNTIITKYGIKEEKSICMSKSYFKKKAKQNKECLSYCNIEIIKNKKDPIINYDIIKNPPLATVIIKLLKDPDNFTELLNPYINIFFDESKSEIRKQIKGLEYLPNIIKSINMELISTEKYTKDFNIEQYNELINIQQTNEKTRKK